MYLKKLEIFGFKSFADKVNIEFKDGITAIVGPNGSGKSNVSDAIKWVLGEQRVKSLRGSKMEDIIFSGTEVRKSLGYAEVTLLIDNELGVFPLEYSEISVTRRLYRSGDSEYYINKTLCRLKDIQDLFSDTGLGKEGYSIIGQGKIDHIVSSNPQERRLLLEEAAGIVKYKNRKLESIRKLEKTQDNLYRITDIISELEKQLPSLEKQAKKAMTFLDLRENLKKVELNLFIHKVDAIKQDLLKLNEDKEVFEQNITQKGQELADKDTEYQNLRKEIQEIDQRLNELNQKNLELSDTHQKSNINIQISITKIENNKNNAEAIQKEITEIEELNKNLMDKVEDLRLSISNMENELRNKNADLISLSQQKIERENIEKVYLENYNRKQENLQQIKNDINNYINKIDILQNKKRYREENLENIQKRIDELQRVVEENNKSKEKYIDEKLDIEKQIASHSKQMDHKKREVQLIQEKVDKSYKELKIYENNYNISSSKYTLLKNNEEFRGYQNSVKELLREKKNNHMLQNNLHDIVGNLLEVPKKYALAIETALGNTIHNLITEDEDTAHECIKILSKNKWGRATFLPLNIIKGKPLNIDHSIKAQNGYIEVACNLVDYDTKYSGIFHNLLGKVVIVEDVNAAKIISKMSQYRYKIVTLGGEIFYPGGAIVGGKQKNNNTSIIQKKQEILDLEVDIQSYEGKINGLNNEIRKLSELRNGNKDKLDSLHYKVNELITEKRVVEQKIIQVDHTIKNERNTHELLLSQIVNIDVEEEKDEGEVVSLYEKVKDLKTKLMELDASTISQTDESLELEIKELDLKIMEIKLIIAKQEEKQLYYQSQLQDFLNTLEANSDKLSFKNSEMTAFLRENDQLKSEIEISDHLIKGFEKEKKMIQEKSESCTNDKLDKNSKIDFLQDRIKELNSETVLMKEAFNKIELKINSKTIELEHLQQSIYESYQMNYAMAFEYRYVIENQNVEYKMMKEYKDKIKALGDVNIGAMEQYKEIKERFEFLTFQRDDLTKAKNALSEIISEISLNMEVQFVEQFNLIEKEFSVTFKKLFNGGDARLIIEDPSDIMETGIEIEVQPPGKKLKNITLLSGGEKALTAIALLFAIINIKPTPFCVLDEIDAALDDSNVDRFSSYLHKVSKENQFITITHRKGTMEIADRLYGISMGQDGVSKVVSVEVTQMLKDEVNA